VMRVRGVTLVELLVVIAIIGMITVGVVQAYVTGISYEERVRVGREESLRYQRFEDRLRAVIERAYLSNDPNDTTTFFLAGVGLGEASGGGAQTLTFTISGERLPAQVVSSNEDFEGLNARFGPQGGVAEVSFSTSPFANPGNEQGLFVREQRPADGDYTQGGFERLFSDQVQSIEFEFFDGGMWQGDWDTLSSEKRLPAAVRVTYRFLGEEDQRTMYIKLPMSDVTPLNPISIEGGGL
jgi:prepilin-type N-terminal cleavage/methylation domain-containing protein